MNLLAKNITFGYSDSEDRMWARLQLVDTDDEYRVWLTRRLCHNICNALIQLIEKNTAIADKADKHNYLKKEFYESSRSTWDPTPEAPKISANNKSANMYFCNKVEISSGQEWLLKFTSNDNKTCHFKANRVHILKILVALIKQTKTAHWNLDIPSTWLNQ